jgi:hypothetical protein
VELLTFAQPDALPLPPVTDCPTETSHATAAPTLELNLQIAKEGLRQAKQSFDLAQQSFKLALVMTAMSALVSFVGVGLLLSGKASEGSVTTAGGLASSVAFLQLAKDASDRLDKANDRLDKIAEDQLR